MTAGRREYFGKENFANFTRKPLKQCKTRSSAVRDPQNLDPAAWRCVKQRQHLPFQGLHPSRVGRQWFSGGQQVGETAAGADHGCWPGRPQWLLLRRLRVGDTLRAFANGRVAGPFTRRGSASLFVLRGRADQEARAYGSAFYCSMAYLACRFCSQITSRFVNRAGPGGRGGGA